ncbi:MAG: pentapeptide repeat-containing protein [Thermodesulfobacteriota bacterium]
MSRYRKIPEDELKEILVAHEKWVDSRGKEGARADLSEAELSGADLSGANLFKADLSGAILTGGANLTIANFNKANFTEAYLTEARLGWAHLIGANLTRADLAEARLNNADLRDANFRNADLHGAKFTEADLQGTVFYGADLSEADLKGVKNLKAEQFGGARIAGAKNLPPHIASSEEDGLENVIEASKNARKIFLAMLVGCVYSIIAIGTTTDADLLTNSASSPLPIIMAKVPVVYFYWAAPAFLVGFYIYFHIYFLRLCQGLAGLPAFFRDGRPLDRRAYPWLLNGLMYSHIELMKKERPLMSRTQNVISVILAWWFTPLTLIFFWGRYIVRQDWLGTLCHVALLNLAVYSGIFFYHYVKSTLQGTEHIRWFAGTMWPIAMVALMLFQIFVVAFAYEGRPYNLQKADLSGTDLTGANLPKANLTGTKLSGADLTGADLTGAEFSWADLTGAYLTGADLTGADLFTTDLTGAHLFGATLSEAHLLAANLTGADLTGANLTGADLSRADLTGATLFTTDLTGAHLEGATLTGAKFFFAKLSGADLSTTDLREVMGLSCDQLTKARIWQMAYRDEDLGCGKDIPGPLEGIRMRLERFLID